MYSARRGARCCVQPLAVTVFVFVFVFVFVLFRGVAQGIDIAQQPAERKPTLRDVCHARAAVRRHGCCTTVSSIRRGLMFWCAVSWYVLCCAVLCCAVLCCAVLCCAVLCCAVLCCAVDFCA
jgi:hypothetical protein